MNTSTDSYTEKLSACEGNLRSVFVIGNNSSGEKTETQLPTNFKSDTELANAFVDFFHGKLTRIRRDIDEEFTGNRNHISTRRSSPANYTGP